MDKVIRTTTKTNGARAGNEQPSAMDHLSREELLGQISGLEEELRLTRAFAMAPEATNGDAILQWLGRNRILAERVLPVGLKPLPKQSLYPTKGDHRIIEGDNLAVMTSLLTEFRGGPNRGVDVIYMDPPYNTGSDVFAYNDSFSLSKAEIKSLRHRMGRSESLVSLDDPNRHTKWINHMAPRLWAARKLLKTTGVIIISIDEHELPRLWMLMEELFGERNRIATLVWSRARKNDAGYVSEGHEYMLVWARNKDELDGKRSRMATTKEWSKDLGRWRKRKDGADLIQTVYMEARAQFSGDVPKIQAALDAFFKKLPEDHPAHGIRYKKVDKTGVYNDDGNLNWPGGGGPRYDIPHPKTRKPVKVPKLGWLFQKPEMLKLIADGRIQFKADHTGVPRLITYLHEMDTEVQTSVIQKSGQRSVETIEAIFGEKRFKNPKDHEMLAELFNLATWRDKEAIILDPYAGSGTTGHAVIEMNAEDLGRRRFILVESGDPKSDSGIPKARYTNEITAERVKRVITGKWADRQKHPAHSTGFIYFKAQAEITKRAIMQATRESLADIILQIVEDDSNRIDSRVEGHTYLIGRTKLGYGIALVWQPSKASQDQSLTSNILDQILDEADKAKVSRPVHIYASSNSAPLSDELYRFHQIPNSILARLGVLDTDGGDDA